VDDKGGLSKVKAPKKGRGVTTSRTTKRVGVSGYPHRATLEVSRPARSALSPETDVGEGGERTQEHNGNGVKEERGSHNTSFKGTSGERRR